MKVSRAPTFDFAESSTCWAAILVPRLVLSAALRRCSLTRTHERSMIAMVPNDPMTMPAMAPGVRPVGEGCATAEAEDWPPKPCVTVSVGPVNAPIVLERPEEIAVLALTVLAVVISRRISVSVICQRIQIAFIYTPSVLNCRDSESWVSRTSLPLFEEYNVSVAGIFDEQM